MAIVTLFHPDEAHLSHLLNVAESGEFDRVFLVQNCQTALTLPLHPRLTLIENGNQGGLGGAFNRGVERAFAEGADYVAIFDQDSQIPHGFRAKMILFILEHDALLAAPDFFDINSGTHGSFGLYDGWKSKVERSNESHILSHYAISSGSIVSREAFERIGPYDEMLFIDHVDTDFHIRAHLKDIDIHVNRAVVLKHAIGQRTRHRFLGLLTIKPNNHSPLRRYFVARNSVAMIRRYGLQVPSFGIMVFARFIHDVLGVIFYERDKVPKLRAMLKGVLHGFLGRLGPATSSRSALTV